MRILILGGDGFCGWPTSLHLSACGHEVAIVDNLARRNADVELEGTTEPVGRLDGFADRDTTMRVLTHPLEGLYRRRDGRLGGYSVWHPRFAPTLGTARTARFAVFEDLGLVRPDAKPHSVMLQRSIDFSVLLPPVVIHSGPVAPDQRFART